MTIQMNTLAKCLHTCICLHLICQSKAYLNASDVIFQALQPAPHLSRWQHFHFSSTALRRRLPAGHLDWERLIMPGLIATLCESAGLETTYLEEGRVGQSRKMDGCRPLRVFLPFKMSKHILPSLSTLGW